MPGLMLMPPRAAPRSPRLNEPSRRWRQWQRHTARDFVPRLGGAPEGWTAANAEVAARLVQEGEVHCVADPAANWSASWPATRRTGSVGCAPLGIAPPPQRIRRLRLVRACASSVPRRVRAALPGAVGAIRLVTPCLLDRQAGPSHWSADA